MEAKFVVIVVSNEKDNLVANAMLFESFDDAIGYARKSAETYKHLASTYDEYVGINKRHATIKLKGKYINKMYRVSNLDTTASKNVLDSHPNTYFDWDYLHDGRAI